ncbi:hypothetical protein EUGRSUZ_H00303 [Eucalyptus grandis]|uniref:Uncharacterized protein n=2 Tax=Eucalyptus grandis TaxID=71139 RepID=A0ACC3JK82_EUCGR|nr:hypothetical protein EUGRSUZ_H00303 [Eucalyptus grandis]
MSPQPGERIPATGPSRALMPLLPQISSCCRREAPWFDTLSTSNTVAPYALHRQVSTPLGRHHFHSPSVIATSSHREIHSSVALCLSFPSASPPVTAAMPPHRILLPLIIKGRRRNRTGPAHQA